MNLPRRRSAYDTANGLHWVRGEIDASLNRGRDVLEQYLESRENLELLRAMLDEMRVVRGTLQVIECFSAMMLSVEMEKLLEALLEGRAAPRDEAFAALSGATLQLSDYLDLLVHGTEDLPLVLQPVINELRLAHGQALITDAELFARHLRARGFDDGREVPLSGSAENSQASARRELAAFQTSFLQWFRGMDNDAAIERIGKIADRIAVNCAAPELGGFWEAIGVLAESLRGRVADSLDIKRLFGRAGSQIKLLAEGGEKTALEQLGDAREQALFHVVRAEQPTERSRGLTARMQLDALLPPIGYIAEVRRRLRGPNTTILDRVAEEIHADFTQIKDSIDLAVRTGGRSATDLAATRDRMLRLAQTLGALGLPVPQQALANQASIIEKLSPGVVEWLEVAIAILRVEHSLDEALFRALGRSATETRRPFDQIEAETPHGRDRRESLESFTRECLVNFAQVKTAVDGYLRKGEGAALQSTPAALAEIAGGLTVVGHERASELVRKLGRFVAAGHLSDLQRPPELFERFADAVSCAEVYVEALRDDLPSPSHILDDLAACLARLQSQTEAPAVPTPAVPEIFTATGEVLPAGAAAAPAAAAAVQPVDPEIRDIFVEEAREVIAQLQEELPSLKREPRNREVLGIVRRAFHTLKGSGRMVGATQIGEFAWAIEQMLNRCLDGALSMRAQIVETVEQAVELLPALIEGFVSGKNTTEPAVAEVAGRASRIVSGTQDGEPDMRAVFREDARERLGFVRRWLEAQNPDLDHFPIEPEVVRAFHTLRGSAAVVHAQGVRELATAFENYLNSVRVRGHSLNVTALALIADALVALKGWIESDDIGNVRAVALEEWHSRIQAITEEPGAAASTQIIDDTFSNGALDLLQWLERQARAWASAPSNSMALDLRAGFAELASKAEKVGCVSIGTVAQAVAARLADWGAGRAPEPLFFTLLLDVCEGLYQLLDAYRDGERTPDATALLEKVQALTPPQVPQRVEIDPELLEIFGGEADELLEALDEDFAEWTEYGVAPAALAALRRNLHTLKGSARTAGVSAMGEVAHRVETELTEIEHATDTGVRARISVGLDGLHEMLARLRRGEPVDAESVLARIAAVQALPLAPPEEATPAESAAQEEPAAASLEIPEDAAASSAKAADLPPIVLDFDRPATDSVPAAPTPSTETVEFSADAFESSLGDAEVEEAAATRPAESDPLPEPIAEPVPAETGATTRPAESELETPQEEPEQAVAEPAAGLPAPVPEEAISEAPAVEPVAASEPEPVVIALVEREAAPEAPRSAAPVVPAPLELPIEPVEEVPLSLVDVPEEDLADVFAAEAAELLEQLDAAFESWQNGEAETSVPDILRVLHTLKGGARMSGLEPMAEAAHQLESRINAAQRTGQFPESDLFALMREKIDALQQMQEQLRRGEAGLMTSAEALEVPAAMPVPSAPAGPLDWAPELFWKPEDEDRGLAAARRETSRVPVEMLDGMLNEVGEISIYRSRLEERTAGLRTQLAEMMQTIVRTRDQLRMMDTETEAQIVARGLSSGSGPDRYAQDFDPLEMDRYSRMQELSRALAESINDLSSLQGSMDDAVRESESLLLQQSRINTQVQQGLMGTLMVPFSRQVQRLARVVRQTAQENGKQAEVHFIGASAELDRNVLERMTAPLEHLLRNAVVHGIEDPQARQRAGKPAMGRIEVSLRREGGQLMLDLRDDGAGLDYDAIRAKAVERGQLAEDTELSDGDLARFIFEPGFSTARLLTQDAGRGIGMDVVSSEVKQLGGALELRSKRGEGAHFQLRLPLSLAVSQALLVGVTRDTYAIPLPAVEGIARIPRGELTEHYRDDGPLFAYGGRGYRVRHLGDYLDLAHGEPEGRSAIAILVRLGERAGGGERRMALVVDRLIGNRDIVTKAVGPQVSNVPGVAGATILADGRVVMILDLAALVAERVRRTLLSEVASRLPTARPARVRDTIMVVDDSITMRRVAERLLTRSGYRVVTAKDGLDAIALLATETPVTILLDIEMPRADGFEVAAFVRNSDRLARTPIIMITSRSGEKHRERARGLGVNRYLIKPYQEDQLLSEVIAVRRGG